MPFPLLFTFVFVSLGWAGDNGNGTFFGWPADDHGSYKTDAIYQIGQNVQLGWSKHDNIGAYNITMWQQSPARASAQQSKHPIYSGSIVDTDILYTWTIQTYEFDIKLSPVFYLSLSTSDAPMTFTSPYFNLTNEPLSSSSMVASTSLISPSLSSATPSTSVSSSIGVFTTASAGAAQVSQTSSSVGLGVGLGVGIPSVLGLLGIVALLYRKRRSQTNAALPSRHQDTPMTGSDKLLLPHGMEDVKDDPSKDHRGPIELEHTAWAGFRIEPVELEGRMQ